MFTILWKAMNGAQMLYSARGEVGFTPADQRGGDYDKPGKYLTPCVSFECAETGAHTTLDSGEVIVMNVGGHTVARYIICSQEFAHGRAAA
jgi:hypothetical protein